MILCRPFVVILKSIGLSRRIGVIDEITLKKEIVGTAKAIKIRNKIHR